MKRNALFAAITPAALVAGYVATAGDIETGRIRPLENVAAKKERPLEDSGLRVCPLTKGPRAVLYITAGAGVVLRIVPAST